MTRVLTDHFFEALEQSRTQVESRREGREFFLFNGWHSNSQHFIVVLQCSIAYSSVSVGRDCNP